MAHIASTNITVEISDEATFNLLKDFVGKFPKMRKIFDAWRFIIKKFDAQYKTLNETIYITIPYTEKATFKQIALIIASVAD